MSPQEELRICRQALNDAIPWWVRRKQRQIIWDAASSFAVAYARERIELVANPSDLWDLNTYFPEEPVKP